MKAECDVATPVAGVVSAVYAQPAQSIAAGAPVIAVTPDPGGRRVRSERLSVEAIAHAVRGGASAVAVAQRRPGRASPNTT
ncbi:hypothetical protein ACRAWD_14545 [Caulobacter segnis]